MKNLFLVVTFLFLTNSFGAMSPEKLFSFNKTLSKNDKDVADLIFNLNLELKRKRPSTYTTSKILSKNTAPTSIFKDFNPSVKNLEKIIKNKKSSSKTYSNCSSLKYNAVPLNPILNKLNKRINNYCNYQSMIHLNKAPDSFAELLKRKEYLNRLFTYILKYHQKTLTKIIKNSEDSHKEEVIRIVSTVVYDNGHTPSKELVSLLTMTTQLTKYIQSNGIHNKSDSKYFLRVFNKLKTKAKKSIKNRDFDKVDKYSSQMIAFYSENTKYLNESYVWKSLILIAYDTLYVGQKEIAKRIFDYTYTFSKGDQFEDVSFYLLWSDLLHKDIKGAIKTIEKYKLVENFNRIGNRAKYWTAHTLQVNGEYSIAKHLFKLIYKNNPLSFYSILSMKKIEEIDSKYSKSKLVNRYKEQKTVFQIPRSHFSNRLISSLERSQVWLSTEHPSYAEDELETIISTPKNFLLSSSDVYSDFTDSEVRRYLSIKLIQEFNRNGNYLQTFKLLYRSFSNNLFDVSSRSLKYLFPFDYLKEIEKIDNTIDPLIVLSLIRQESAFNPTAKSRVGARGLMQIMPKTAKSMNKRVVASHLKTPETNIKLGVRYLKKLLRSHNGNLIYALASYNAGPSRVKKWISNHFISEEPLYILESIPYRETRNYVKLIYRNIFFYNLLQDKNRLTLSMDESFMTKLND